MTMHYDPLPDAAATNVEAVYISTKPYTRSAGVHSVGARSAGRDVEFIASAGAYRAVFKRVLDITLVIIAAPVVLLVVGLLAVGIAFDGANPFYSQSRVGRGGRLYKMWKLRSMVVNADAELETYLATDPAARAEWDSTQKLKIDPRITRFGRILRKSSLDELPQLWNVLIGNMSLVGPRPMMPCQQDIYPGSAYYRLRPGITGPWQVSRRNESTFADRARFDTDYDRSLSLAGDIGLLIGTVRVVVRATGY